MGDEEVTRESGLEEKEVGKPSMPSITWMSLQLEHARCAEIVAAANHLGLPILEQTAKVAIDYLSVIAKRTHNKNLEPRILHPEDYAQTMKAIVEDIQQTVVPMARACDTAMVEQSCESPDEIEVLPGTSSKKVDQNSEKDDGGEQSREDCVDVNIDDDEDGDVVGDVHNESDKKIEKQKGHVKTKASRKTKEKKTGKQPLLQVSTAKKPHDTKKKCPLCQKEVVHLSRHLHDRHVKKNEKIPLVRVEPLVQMAKHGNTVEGGKRRQKCKEGEKLYKRKKKICPLCDKVSMYLTTHLQRVHKLKTKSTRKRLNCCGTVSLSTENERQKANQLLIL